MKWSSEFNRFLPVVVVVTLIFVIAAVFLLDHCGYLLSYPDTAREGVWQSAVFSFLALLTSWCYVLSVTTPAGRIPDTSEWLYAESEQVGVSSSLVVSETKRDGRRRACKWCAKWKPDRCHHCRVCKACVLRMDHHCPWIGSCVGHGNHKPFLLLLLYATITCVFVAVCTGYHFERRMVQTSTEFAASVFGLSLVILSSCLSLVVGAFFLFHLYLTANALTTIEYCEKMRSVDFDPGTYNRGVYGNFKNVLGESIWLWFIPVGLDNGDGLGWFKTSKQDDWVAPETDAPKIEEASKPLLP